ncbi:MAG TPA: S9 family peptidase [Steroidobacteraceae bacterium]
MRTSKRASFALTAALAACVCSAHVQSMADDMRSIMTTTDYREVALSPDHRRLAWVQAAPGNGGDFTIGTSIYLAPAGKNDSPVNVTAPARAEPLKAPPEEDSPAWSPDSSMLAFLSDAESPGQKQLYLYDTAHRSARRLTSVKGYLATPLWSHDGRSIAVLFTENSSRVAGPLSAGAPVAGVVDAQVFEQRIAVVDTATGTLRQVSPADLYVYEYDWSPDGKNFVATAAHGSGDNNWYVAELYVIDAAAGGARSILRTTLQIAAPKWSPDGRNIAYIGGLSSDESIASGNPYVIPAAGGTPKMLARERRSSAFWLAWRSSEDLVLAEAADGGSALTIVNVKTNSIRTLYQGADTLRGPANYARGISIASDGKSTAAIRETFNEAPMILSGEIGAWRPQPLPLSRPSAQVPWGNAVSVHWQNEGFDVQGWLVPPKTLSPGTKYPMVVWVHGGPAWLTAPSWPTVLGDSPVLLAAHGYFVFYPNPRGSSGFGETFKRANIKDFGGGDLRDILAGIDHVIKTQPVDNDRVGLSGWSYGGYMTMWALTQTQRFRAGVVGAGLADWLSYYGENGIDEWMIPYFGASVYEDPAVYAKSSPINFVKNVRTPTLLVVGDSDVECPTPQSFEYWHALKEYKVKTELVVYPNEGHQFKDPAHAVDVMERMLAWFDANMPPKQE